MALADLGVVAEVERLSFSNPWPVASYVQELSDNRNAHYFVACRAAPDRPGNGGGRPPEVVGYGGIWMQYDEAHINTLAVHPRCRRRGIGERLLVRLMECALEVGAVDVTLEVRSSNDVAQRLYRKYGFEAVGDRRRYYSDNGEDALIMTTPDLYDPAWRLKFEDLRARIRRA